MKKLESDPFSKVQRRPVHGVLLLDKPLGLSSNNALQKCKWLLRAEKAGHTGTLDPLATGVLPLCFGAATKFSQLQLDADKTYAADVQLGAKTTTGDAEGEVIEVRPVPELAPERLAAVARQFTGPLRQVPPMHSALKKDGRALYEYARAGVAVEREPRDVLIRDLSLAPVPGKSDLLRMVARVSKGTYIRTLGEAIGDALGCGAHLASLRRTATGEYQAVQCVTLEALEAMSRPDRLACLRPVDSMLGGHMRVVLDANDAGRFLSGLRRRGPWADNDRVAVYGPAPSPQPSHDSGRGSSVYGPPPAGARGSDGTASYHPLPLAGEGRGEGCLLGTGRTEGGELIPVRLLSPPEISQILESKQ